MDWWGFSDMHGWVVLDRTTPCNRPGINNDFMFIRCRDFTSFLVPRSEWNQPYFIFAPNYLKKLSVVNRDKSTLELELLKIEWGKIKASVKLEEQKIALEEQKMVLEEQKIMLEKKSQQVISNHKYFLESRGYSYQGTHVANPENRRRITHCYFCKFPLDNTIDAECCACGWIVCGCGACGCGRIA